MRHITYHFICRLIESMRAIIAPRQCYLSFYLCYTFLLLSVAQAAEPDTTSNHFRTTNEHTPQSSAPSQQLDPLKAYPVSQYIVHGVVVMEDNALAIVYTPRNTWHKLHVSSQLGIKQAVVRQITINGIQLDMHGTLLWLPVLQ